MVSITVIVYAVRKSCSIIIRLTLMMHFSIDSFSTLGNNPFDVVKVSIVLRYCLL